MPETEKMMKKIITLLILALGVTGCQTAGTPTLHANISSSPIYHEKYYPDGSGPFPAVIALHTSGGVKTVKHLIQRYVDDGFAVYAPDFFKRHGLTPKARMETFSTYRENIEEELTEIVDLVKNDPKINKKNVFAGGYSNG